MTDLQKFWAALNTLKANTQCTVNGDVLTENDFNNNILWKTAEDENGLAISTTTCPHSEITWTKLKAEMDKL